MSNCFVFEVFTASVFVSFLVSLPPQANNNIAAGKM